MTKSGSSKPVEKSPVKKSPVKKMEEKAKQVEEAETVAIPGVVIKQEKLEKAKSVAEGASTVKKKRVKQLATKKPRDKGLLRKKNVTAEKSAEEEEAENEEQPEVAEEVVPLQMVQPDQDVEKQKETEKDTTEQAEPEKQESKERETEKLEEEEKSKKEKELQKKREEDEQWNKMMEEIREEAEEKGSEQLEEKEEKESEAAEEMEAEDAEVESEEQGKEESEDEIDEEVERWIEMEEKKREEEKGKAKVGEKRKRQEAEMSAKREEVDPEKKKQLENLKKKKFLQEQGFEPELKDIPEGILRTINERGWRKFCVPHKQEARGVWVREFYANIEDEESCCSKVQGKMISWNAEDWNKLYKLKPGRYCQYEELLRAPSKSLLGKCLQVIGKENAQWTGGVKKKTFQSCMLNSEAHAWATFIKSCLMPTSHDSTLTMERCLLIYAIMEGLYVDVGKLLVKEIQRWLLKSIGKIFFPHHISALCAKQGVKPKPSDDIQRPRIPLNAFAEPKVKSAKNNPAGSGKAAGIAEMMVEHALLKKDLQKYFAYAAERDIAFTEFFAEFKKPGPQLPPFPDILPEESSEEE